MKKVLLTAVGCPGAPSIINLLQNHYELYGVDNDKEAVGFHFIQGQKVSYGTNEKYIPELKRIISQQEIDFILPMSTNELLSLSTYKENWKKTLRCKALVSNYDKLKIAINKCLLYDFFDSEDFIPDYCMLNGKYHFEEDIVHFVRHYDTIFAKPCDSNGSRGLFKIVKDLKNEISFNNKPVPWQIITITEFLSLLWMETEFPSMLLSEYIEGKEWSVDCVIDGDFFYGVTRIRDEIRSGICTRGHLRYNKSLLNLSKQIVKALGLQYNINLQFIEKGWNTGNFKLIEINPRVSGTIALSSQTINLPLLALKLAEGDAEYIEKINYKIKKERLPRSEWMKMIRHYKEIFYK